MKKEYEQHAYYFYYIIYSILLNTSTQQVNSNWVYNKKISTPSLDDYKTINNNNTHADSMIS